MTAAALGLALGSLVVALAPSVDALPETPTPGLSLHGVVHTDPFVRSHRRVIDSEGSAYVRRDHSIWLADDDGERLLEVSTRTGEAEAHHQREEPGRRTALERRTSRGRQPGRRPGEPGLQPPRRQALRLLRQLLQPSARPTVFRLTRNGRGNLHLDSYQALPGRERLHRVGVEHRRPGLYSRRRHPAVVYRYAANAIGPIGVPGLGDVLGMTFTPDGRSLFVARSPALVSRIDWATLTLGAGWTFDLAPYGMADARRRARRRPAGSPTATTCAPRATRSRTPSSSSTCWHPDRGPLAERGDDGRFVRVVRWTRGRPVRSSPRPTVGVEWEFALVDRATRDLSNTAADLFDAVPPCRDPDRRVQAAPGAAAQHRRAGHRRLRVGARGGRRPRRHDARRPAYSESLGVDLYSAGTHPFAQWSVRLLTPGHRYEELISRTQWWGRQMLIWGLHVHVGVAERSHVLPIVTSLLNYVRTCRRSAPPRRCGAAPTPATPATGP